MSETKPADDRLLIDAFLQGDPDAIRSVDLWIDAGLRGGFVSLRSEWDDLRQEVRSRLIGNLQRARFAGRSSLRTYVHRITRNVCIDLMRRVSSRRERGLSEHVPHLADAREPERMAAWIARDIVSRILATLDERERHLLALVFNENCSYAEVARRLGISENAVKSRVFRCKGRVLQQYERLARGKEGGDA